MNSELAPIVIFAYNRVDHLKATIDHLKKNELAKDSDVYIYSDAAKSIEDLSKVDEVRKYLKTINGFSSLKIVEREYNWGLSRSIIDGVTSVVNKYGKIIVLEDDLVTSPYFLNFMNDGLNTYKNVSKVCQIMGYSYVERFKEEYNLDETYFVKGSDCLGWATWRDAWLFFSADSYELIATIEKNRQQREFNRNDTYNYMEMLNQQAKGEVDSWAIRWYASAFLNNLYTLYPLKSLVLHIGNDGEGANYNSIDSKYDPLNVSVNMSDRVPVIKMDVLEKTNTNLAYNAYLRSYKRPLWIKLKNKLRLLLRNVMSKLKASIKRSEK